MASVNRVILIGNLGKGPEVKHMPSGDAVANFSIATTEKFKDKSGSQKEHTEWHRISFFGRLAEIAGEYLKKGSPVYVEGRIRTRKWQDKEGNERFATEIIGDRMQFLGLKNAQGGGDEPPAPAAKQQPAPDKAGGGFDEMVDDIPF